MYSVQSEDKGEVSFQSKEREVFQKVILTIGRSSRRRMRGRLSSRWRKRRGLSKDDTYNRQLPDRG